MSIQTNEMNKEILEIANKIGININEDYDLLYLAKDYLKTELPSTIKICKTAKGEIYYINTKTQDIYYENPNLIYFKNKYQEEKTKKIHQSKIYNSENENITFREKLKEENNNKFDMEKELREIENSELQFQFKEIENLRLEFSKKIDEERNNRLNKRKEILLNLTEAKKINLSKEYEIKLEKEKEYLNFESEKRLKTFETVEKSKIENVIINEIQQEREKIIENELRTTNFLRKEIDESLLNQFNEEKMNLSKEINSKKKILIKKCSLLNQMRTEIDSLNNSNRSVTDIDQKIYECENILKSLQGDINKIQNENKLLIIELSTLSNQISIGSEQNSDRNKNENEINLLIKELNDVEDEITNLKSSKKTNKSIQKQFNRIILNNIQYDEISNIKFKKKKNYNKSVCNFEKKITSRNKSFITFQNESNFLTDSEKENNGFSKKFNKSEFLKTRNNEKINDKKDIQTIKKRAKDWNSILKLEQDKLNLLAENLKKEKIIAKSKQQKLVLESVKMQKNKKNLNESYSNTLQENSYFIFNDVWTDLNQEMKMIKEKEVHIKSLKNLLNDLIQNFELENEDKIELKYNEYVKISSKKESENYIIEEGFDLSNISEKDDIDFYKNWKKNYENYIKSQEILFTEENNQNKTVPKLKPSDLTEDISIFDHSLNFTKKENDFNTRLNQSYRVEDKSFLNKSKGIINSKIVKRYHNEKDGIENEMHKHHNWLSNLKTQLSSNYYFKPYDDLIKKYTSSSYSTL